MAKLEIEVANDSDIELTKGFAPVLINVENGAIYFIGESIYITLPPKTSEKREWTTPLNLVQQATISADTEFYIAFP